MSLNAADMVTVLFNAGTVTYAVCVFDLVDACLSVS